MRHIGRRCLLFCRLPKIYSLCNFTCLAIPQYKDAAQKGKKFIVFLISLIADSLAPPPPNKDPGLPIIRSLHLSPRPGLFRQTEWACHIHVIVQGLCTQYTLLHTYLEPLRIR